METDNTRPYLQIIDQPVGTFRFRYESEIIHGTHGSLNSMSSTNIKRMFPTVQLINFTGDAKIRCSLFQVASTLRPHCHSLVVRRQGKDYAKDPHDEEVSHSKGYTATFKGMGIYCAAKELKIEELHRKLVNRISLDKRRDITQRETLQLRSQAESEVKQMNFSKVCLCFEAFDKNWIKICEPVLSNPIHDHRNAKFGDLKITRLSTNISEANGGDEVFLFVEKVVKNDIKVRFFEIDENEELVWEDWGIFSETDVHHQYAIALRTPPYREKNIEETVTCFIQLFRPSNKSYSDAKPFRYKPSHATATRKRARVNTPYSSAELPTVSVEDCNPSLNHELESFLKNFSANLNTEDLESLIDPADFLNMTEISKELQGLQESGLKTDCVVVGSTKEQYGPELLICLMDKMCLTNSTEKVAETFKHFFHCEYECGRFILDFLIINNPPVFKLFLILVETLKIADVLNYQNDRKKSCFHLVCENCSVETIVDIVPILIRLGADPNSIDNQGDAVLHVLVRDENLSKCVDVFVNALYPKNIKLNLEIQNYDGWTPLLLATRLNRSNAVLSLLKTGVSVEGVNSRGNNKGGTKPLTRKILASLHLNNDQLFATARSNQITKEAYNNYMDLAVMENVKQKNVIINMDKIFDVICLEQLSLWFNRADKWKTLASHMNFETFVSFWDETTNPSKMLFGFLQVQGTNLTDIIATFKQLNESIPLMYIDEMVARQLENDYFRL